MSDSIEPPPFECPFCQSEMPQKSAAKHLLNQHNDTRTLHKYVTCSICKGLFIKHKLTPHLRKAHKTSPAELKKGGKKPQG